MWVGKPVGVGPLLLSSGPRGIKLNCQARCQVPVHTEPSLPACTQESGSGRMSIISASGGTACLRLAWITLQKLPRKKFVLVFLIIFYGDISLLNHSR